MACAELHGAQISKPLFDNLTNKSRVDEVCYTRFINVHTHNSAQCVLAARHALSLCKLTGSPGQAILMIDACVITSHRIVVDRLLAHTTHFRAPVAGTFLVEVPAIRITASFVAGSHRLSTHVTHTFLLACRRQAIPMTVIRAIRSQLID